MELSNVRRFQSLCEIKVEHTFVPFETASSVLLTSSEIFPSILSSLSLDAVKPLNIDYSQGFCKIELVKFVGRSKRSVVFGNRNPSTTSKFFDTMKYHEEISRGANVRPLPVACSSRMDARSYLLSW